MLVIESIESLWYGVLALLIGWPILFFFCGRFRKKGQVEGQGELTEVGRLS